MSQRNVEQNLERVGLLENGEVYENFKNALLDCRQKLFSKISKSKYILVVRF